eukprot:607810-Rhodomonas_salina.1
MFGAQLREVGPIVVYSVPSPHPVSLSDGLHLVPRITHFPHTAHSPHPAHCSVTEPAPQSPLNPSGPVLPIHRVSTRPSPS